MSILLTTVACGGGGRPNQAVNVGESARGAGEGAVPLSPRSHPVLSASSGHVLVLGGETSSAGVTTLLTDGALWDDSAKAWTKIPSPPIEAALYRPQVAWSKDGFVIGAPSCGPVKEDGRELVDICRPRTLRAARFDLPSREWTPLPDIPTRKPADVEFAEFGRLSATDTSILASVSYSYSQTQEFWRLDIAGGAWNRVEDPPIENISSLCDMSGSLVAISILGSTNLPLGPNSLPQQGSRSLISAAQLTPDGVWRPLPDPPTTAKPPNSARTACGEGSFGMVSSPEDGGELEARVFDLGSNAWSIVGPIAPDLGGGQMLMGGSTLAVVASDDVRTYETAGKTSSSPSLLQGADQLKAADTFIVGLWDDADMHITIQQLD